MYLPGGTYQLGSTLELRVGTVITGDPLDLPVLKAAEGFRGEVLVKGYDEGNGNPETSFMTLMRNVKLDMTALGGDVEITALQWGVAQGAGLTNVEIEMPENSSGHTGIDIKAGSTIAVTDVVYVLLSHWGNIVLTKGKRIGNHRWRYRYQKLQPTGQLQEYLVQGLHDCLRGCGRPHSATARGHL